jgi:hypothetical protein
MTGMDDKTVMCSKCDEAPAGEGGILCTGCKTAISAQGGLPPASGTTSG